MSRETEKTDTCPDCGAPLIRWEDAKTLMFNLLVQHTKEIERIAAEGTLSGEPDMNTEKLTTAKLHADAYTKAFLHWLVAHEWVDMKTIIGLLSDMTDGGLRIVLFTPGTAPPEVMDGRHGNGGHDMGGDGGIKH